MGRALQRAGLAGFFMVMAGLFGSTGASGAEAPPIAVPGWAGFLSNDIQPPSELSDEGKATCEARVLNALNQRFEIDLDAADIASVRAPGWPREERGFIRGGGYNIRVVVADLSATQVARMKVGRFEGDDDAGHRDSLVSSLHVPGAVNGVQLFQEAKGQNGQVTLDFTAHIDSAYAYDPLGLFAHLFKDVFGAAHRDPCPAPGVDD